jgi:hypothetical protein
MQRFDYIVVGSGSSGSMAAQTLVEAGANVAMLDVGVENKAYASLVPDEDFLQIRKNHPDQHRYFIGNNAEGLTWGDIGKGAQITPSRKHLTELVDTYLPLDSKTFSPIESLGYGGLGIGWGLQCWEFSDSDLLAAGLDKDAMRDAYETVSKRIGISATHDNASRYTLGTLKTFQPSAAMDRNHQRIYQKYTAREAAFNKRGIYVGRTPLALLTQDLGHRKAYAYRDMDFYTDNNLSAWRPWITIDQLRTQPTFTYIANQLVVSFKEKKDHIVVTAIDVTNHTTQTFQCRKLILAANPFSSGRIVLRSVGKTGQTLPFLCNPYTYIPCLQPAFIGKEAEPKKLGFAQLTLFLDEQHNNTDISVASLYSYQSLMLFRIIRQAPLNFSDARILMRYLLSGIEIMGVHHPDKASNQKYMQLVESQHTPTGDTLKIHYALQPEELAEQDRRERRCIAAMRSMGVYALKRINPGYGASVHYAGTLPFSNQDKPLTLDRQGKLHGTKGVYVADSSGFTYLPAKGLTFSLLANAHITAERALTS